MDNLLTWLQQWYQRQCDGEWEHTFGVRIDTLDNPGWRVTIDLTGTELQGRPYGDYHHVAGPDSWVHCEVVDEEFRGYGGPNNLPEILQCFRNWAESEGRPSATSSWLEEVERNLARKAPAAVPAFATFRRLFTNIKGAARGLIRSLPDLARGWLRGCQSPGHWSAVRRPAWGGCRAAR